MEEAAVLFATVDSVGNLDLNLNASDLGCLRVLVSNLEDPVNSAWLVLMAAIRIAATETLNCFHRARTYSRKRRIVAEWLNGRR
ncbi:hypothetical protein IWX81_000972 [Salinibacterium sp. CAN_S4]|uniref:hypothetical protein n=1 Tax=Salinibacterium sp. CAN_S4 TaxID=2787727 RepID=UPI0018EF5DD7